MPEPKPSPLEVRIQDGKLDRLYDRHRCKEEGTG